MKKSHRFAILILILIAAHALVPAASAHPLGNFTINHYAGLRISREAVFVEYILDMAEIPAFQEIAALDANGNGQAEYEEKAGYHPAKCASLRQALELRLNGRPVPLILESSTLEFPPGVGGLPTLRLTCIFNAPLEAQQNQVQIAFQNNAFPKRLGWREIVVNVEDVTLIGDFATTSLSQRLTSYPEDLLTTPLDQRHVSFEIWSEGEPGVGIAPSAVEDLQTPIADRNDAFTRLILLEEINFPTLLLALMISFIWGAMHALTPGHGKTIVGAYLVGSRGTPVHALYLGVTTTITHTAGVIALGAVTLLASRFILPERLFPWLNFISGLLVAGIGLNLFLTRWQTARRTVRTIGDKAFHLTHHDPHDHRHSNVGAHSHHHIHPHEKDHSHTPGHSGHSHLPPGADGAPVTWRSLLALGISGGLLPCPSALVVMLGAIALNRVGLGLILVLAFSVGLAGVLALVGLAFVYTGRLFDRIPHREGVLRYVPIASALFITLAGLAITARAVMSIGL